MPPMPPEMNAMRLMTGRARSRQISCSTTGLSMTSPSLPIFIHSFCLTLHCESDTHAAADAQRRQPPSCVALGHLVEQRDQDAAAGGADRMAERNCAAVHVDLARVPAHLAIYCDRLGRECFVDLHEVEVLRLPAGARE